MATKSLLFVGAGAVGSYIGAFLSRAGHDVTYIDPWPEQVEAIRTRGISVTGPHDPFQAKAKALHIHEAQQLDAPFDIAFIAMKTYDTAWATHLALSHVKPEGFVVSAQNCWNDPVVAGIAGATGRWGSSCRASAWRCGSPARSSAAWSAARAPGHDVFRAGEHDGKITPRIEELASMLKVIDGARATDNLWGERWAKLSQNAMGNPVQAMTGPRLGGDRGRGARARDHDSPRRGVGAGRAGARPARAELRRLRARALGGRREARGLS